jgi:hypothetical protein
MLHSERSRRWVRLTALLVAGYSLTVAPLLNHACPTQPRATAELHQAHGAHETDQSTPTHFGDCDCVGTCAAGAFQLTLPRADGLRVAVAAELDAPELAPPVVGGTDRTHVQPFPTGPPQNLQLS